MSESKQGHDIPQRSAVASTTRTTATLAQTLPISPTTEVTAGIAVPSPFSASRTMPLSSSAILTTTDDGKSPNKNIPNPRHKKMKNHASTTTAANPDVSPTAIMTNGPIIALAYVNGYPVPSYIPSNQILVYFPHGILGLKKVSSALRNNSALGAPSVNFSSNYNTPSSSPPLLHQQNIFLQPDGSLQLEANTHYVLISANDRGWSMPRDRRFSAMGRSRRRGRRHRHRYDSSDSSTESDSEDTTDEEDSSHSGSDDYSDDEGPEDQNQDEARRRMGNEVQMENPQRYSSTPSEQQPTATNTSSENIASLRANISPHSGQKDYSMTPDEGRSNTTAAEEESYTFRHPGGGGTEMQQQKRMKKSGGHHRHHHHHRKKHHRHHHKGGFLGRFFQKTTDMKDPTGKKSDPVTRDLWIQERRRVLKLFLLTLIAVFLTMVFTIVWDNWYYCECAQIGMWDSCSTCAVVHRNFTAKKTIEKERIDLIRCTQSDNFHECSNPNYFSLRALILITSIGIGIFVVIVVVDLVFGFTPRRPFYPFYYLLIWCMVISTWVMYANGCITPVGGYQTQVECAFDKKLRAVFEYWVTILNGGEVDASGALVVGGDVAAIPLTDIILIEPLLQDCHYGLSLWVFILSWLGYTLFGGVYFYSRYMSWRGWGKVQIGKPEDATIDNAGPPQYTSPTQMVATVAMNSLLPTAATATTDAAQQEQDGGDVDDTRDSEKEGGSVTGSSGDEGKKKGGRKWYSRKNSGGGRISPAEEIVTALGGELLKRQLSIGHHHHRRQESALSALSNESVVSAGKVALEEGLNALMAGGRRGSMRKGGHHRVDSGGSVLSAVSDGFAAGMQHLEDAERKKNSRSRGHRRTTSGGSERSSGSQTMKYAKTDS